MEPRNHQIDLRASQQAWDNSAGRFQQTAVKHILMVSPTKFSPGKLVPASPAEASGEYAVTYFATYIGGGKVIECSPAFLNRVQVTACLNIGKIAGMNGRKWTKHGRLPYLTYDMAAETPAGSATAPAERPRTSGG